MNTGSLKDSVQAITRSSTEKSFTLISPRIAVQKSDFLGSGIPYWPVELAILAAFLKERGLQVNIVDLFGSSPDRLEDMGDHYLQGEPFNEAVARTQVAESDIFIIFALSYMSLREICSIAESIRAMRPDSVIVVLENSQAVTSFAIENTGEMFFKAGADALLAGEVYWNWDEIQGFLSEPDNNEPPCNVLSKFSTKPGQVRRIINMHPSYPVPAWDMFTTKGYWSLPYSHGPKARKYLPIFTSRGCPYACDFCVSCSMNQKRWRGREPEEVVDEMLTLRDRFGVRHFHVEDLNPTVRGTRWDRICRLLIEKNANIFFYFVSGTKAETIKIDQVETYARAGCRYISISPESGSKEVLKAMGKPFDHRHALELVRECRRHGIYTQACFLVGHPSEKERDHELSKEYLRSMVRAGLDEVAVFVVSPFAGSELFKGQAIELESGEALVSFSPRGRKGWDLLERRRGELIRIFFIEKLKKGPDIWLQGMRALVGAPRTKMENLPRRILYIYWLEFKLKLSKLFKLF